MDRPADHYERHIQAVMAERYPGIDSVQCPATIASTRAVAERVWWLYETGGLETYPLEAFQTGVQKVPDPFDLDNLRFREPFHDKKRNKEVLLTPNLVRNFVARLNALPDEGTPIVIGIGTGGTPSMDSDDGQGLLTTKHNFDSLIDHPKVAEVDCSLRDRFEILGVDFFKTDSSQLLIDDVGDLVIATSYIWQNMRPALRKRFHGFLIIHGTDTKSKSGAHSATMLGEGMPFNIAHVGSQREIGHPRSDFPTNIADGFAALDIMSTSGLAESVIVMGRKMLLTIGTNKISGENLAAMDSPRHRVMVDLSKVDPSKHIIPPDLYRMANSSKPFQPVVYRGPNRVRTLRAEVDEDPTAIITTVWRSAALAILMVPYHGGTYDANEVDLIAHLSEARNPHPVVKSDRTRQFEHRLPIFAVHPTDEKTDLDRYKAAAAEFRAAGVVALNMTENAARAQIMRALAECDINNPSYAQNVIAEVLNDTIGETAYLDQHYMYRFPIVTISNLLNPGRFGEQAGVLILVDCERSIPLAIGQILSLSMPIEKRQYNADLVLGTEGESVVASTQFYTSTLAAIESYGKAKKDIQKRLESWNPQYQHAIDQIEPPIMEIITRITNVINNTDTAIEFMQEHEIAVTSANYKQLLHELLFIWSNLTGNNLDLPDGPRGPENYAPVAVPDSEGIIRRLDYDAMIGGKIREFLELSSQRS